MKTKIGTTATKPLPVLKKSLKIEFKEFSKAATKLIGNAATAQWQGTTEGAVEVLATLGLSTTPSELAWLLVYRAILRSLHELVNESFETEDVTYYYSDLIAEVNKAMLSSNISINRKFFEAPEQEKSLKPIKEALSTWLISKSLNPSCARSISERLPAYFALALHDEWSQAPRNYEVLRENIDTPFTKASERVQRWSLYSASLLKQVEEPMFNESFSLNQVFVPPRAFYSRREAKSNHYSIDREAAGDKVVNVVVDLKDYLDAWIQKGDCSDAIRLLSGGPGSGKSSFAKMYAATLARRQDLAVIFIPLHHFEPAADLVDAVGKYIQIDGFLSINPLAAEYRDKRLVLIFDGLDELAMQGKIAERTAQDFVREVQRKVSQINNQKTCLQVIISGRELIVQQSESDFRKTGQILHLLPYFVPADEQGLFQDDGALLVIDQRDSWWENYGKATGNYYLGLPPELRQEHLVEITSQPLLNYLVALSLKRGELEFSKETNLNAVYADLLKAIYERGWSKQQHAAIQGVAENDFYRILEEIALAAWHGDGRKTTVRDITTHCDNSGLHALLSRFQIGLEKNSTSKVTQLLTAFYFRQSGQDASGEKTFEFTHKSFGEYLAARRIIREIGLIIRNLSARQSDPDMGWDERDCLLRWSSLCGAAAVDKYLFNFILNELRLIYKREPDLVGIYQETLSRLFRYVLSSGLPIERKNSSLSFKEECVRARNAEESLFICLNACARTSQRISKVDWPDRNSFGDWLAKTGGREFEWRPLLLTSCLSYLDLSRCNLNSQFLYESDLSNSKLSSALIVGADLRYSNVENSIMEKTTFSLCNLMGTSFAGAKLEGADFSGARLNRHTRLPGVGFSKENLACFSRADLKHANFVGCDLRRVDFKEANLEGACFRHGILGYSDFTGANLRRADFRFASLENAIFEGADLADAIFESDNEAEDFDELDDDEDRELEF